jgi:hypothetical protein
MDIELEHSADPNVQGQNCSPLPVYMRCPSAISKLHAISNICDQNSTNVVMSSCISSWKLLGQYKFIVFITVMQRCYCCQKLTILR